MGDGYKASTSTRPSGKPGNKRRTTASWACFKKPAATKTTAGQGEGKNQRLSPDVVVAISLEPWKIIVLRHSSIKRYVVVLFVVLEVVAT